MVEKHSIALIESAFDTFSALSGAAIDQSAELFRRWVEFTPAAIAMLDKELRYISVSRRWMTDFGLENQNVIGRLHYEVFPNIPKRWKDIHRRTLAGEILPATEDKVTSKDGSEQWLKREVRPWFSADQSVGGIIIFSEDITHHKHVEERQHRRTRRYEMLLDITQALLEKDCDESTLAETIFHKIGPPLEVDICFNYRFDKEAQLLRLAAGFGIPPQFKEATQVLALGQALCGMTAATHQPTVANSSYIQKIPEAELMRSMNITAYVCHPLLDSNDKLLGTLSFGSTKRKKFAPEDVDFMHAVCHFLAMAWQRKQVEERLRENEAEMASQLIDSELLHTISSKLIQHDNIETLYESIIEAAAAIMRSDYASMQMYYPQRGKNGSLGLLAHRNFTDAAAKHWKWVDAKELGCTCGIALHTRKRCFVSNVEASTQVTGKDRETYLQTGIQAVQSTPLFSRTGELVGIISTHWKKPHQSSEYSLRIFDLLARQAADLIERKQAEERLRKSESALQRVHHIGRIATMSYELKKGVADYTPEYLAMHGLPSDCPSETREQWQARVHPEDRDIADQAISDALSGAVPMYESQFRIIWPSDGSTHWIMARGEVERDSHTGEAVRLIITQYDVTAQRAAEQALRESEERFRLLASTAPVGIFCTDLKGNCLYVNECWLRISGMTPEEAIGMGWTKALHTEDRDDVIVKWNEAVVNLKPFSTEYRFVTPAGDITWVMGHAVPEIRNEKVTGYIGTITDITQRKIADIERQKLAKLVERSQDFIGMATLEGKLIYLNPCARRMIGVEEGEDISRIHFYDYVPEPWRDFFLNAVIATSRTKGLSEGEMQLMHLKTKKPIDVSRSTFLIKDEKTGEPYALATVTRDITERKKAENALRESEARFRYLADSVPVLIWMSDRAKAGVYFNKPWLDFTGCTMEEELGEGWLARIHPEDVETGLAPCGEAFAKREPFQTQFRLKRADGEYRWMFDIGVPRFSPDNEFLGYIGSCMDITERKQADEIIHKADERFRTMADAAPVLIWETDANGVTYVNGHYLDFFGIDFTAISGMGWAEFMHPKDSFACIAAYLKAFARREPYRHECRFRRADGEYRWLLSTGQPLGEDRFVGFSADITEHKQNEAALIKAKTQAEAANQAKTDFLANMSHEIRTPMNVIVGLSHILGMDKTLPFKKKEMIDTLQMSAQSLMQLINDLLDIAKIETNKVEMERIAFRVSDVVHKVISVAMISAKGKGISLGAQDCYVPETHYFGDPNRIGQIISNLVSNAVKFTQEGEVTVICGISPHEKPGWDQIEIMVKDTGIGISADKIDAIFEKFTQAEASTTRRFGGTGLGLAISRNLAEIMGGSLTAKSEPGQGSTFILDVPLERCQEGDETIQAGTERSIKTLATKLPEEAAKRPCVLLVEDYAPNVLVAKTVLESLDRDYELASNGNEALEKIRRQRAKYCAVLMDVQMPEMDGLEVTRIIRKEESEKGLERLPIIAMTAFAMKNDREHCLEAGMDGYISKPFQLEELVNMLQKYNS